MGWEVTPHIPAKKAAAQQLCLMINAGTWSKDEGNRDQDTVDSQCLSLQIAHYSATREPIPYVSCKTSKVTGLSKAPVSCQEEYSDSGARRYWSPAPSAAVTLSVWMCLGMAVVLSLCSSFPQKYFQVNASKVQTEKGLFPSWYLERRGCER